MAKRGAPARKKGHRLELSTKKDLRSIGFPECITTRQGSPELDALGIDLMHTGPFDFQCKSVEAAINIPKVLDKMTEFNEYNFKIIVHQRDRKKYAYMKYEDLMEMIEMLRSNDIIDG